jgi:hypothetical protein
MMRDIHRHVDAEVLERYSMGTSPSEEIPLIEEHLLMCEGCQERLRQTDEYLLAMRASSEQLRRDEKAAEGRQWRIPAWFPVLAAVACVIVLVVATPRFVQRPGPVVAVSLAAWRSDGAGSNAPSGRQLILHPDLTGLAESSSYRLEIVDQTGHRVWQGTLSRAHDGIQAPALRAGLHFVRVYLPAGELLREYGLQIQ